AVAEASPGALLAVATPGLDDGPAGEEARRGDLAGLAPPLAWRAVGLDLDQWPTRGPAPIVLRGVGLAADDLGHDLATSPELDAQVAGREGRGMLLGDPDEFRTSHPTSGISHPRSPGHPPLLLTARPLDDGPAGDELLGHALAAIDARWV